MFAANRIRGLFGGESVGDFFFCHALDRKPLQ